jgi:RNA recognition motif-containing protein
MSEKKELYIGNLSYELSENEVRQLFEDINVDLDTLKLVTDRDTGNPRGFGFATCKTQEGAETAIEKLNNREVKGRNLSVKFSEPRAKTNNSSDRGNDRRPRSNNWNSRG